MDFGYVLKRAWQIIWKFKVLWIFGILASCGQAKPNPGSNSEYRYGSGDSAVSNQINQFFNQLNPAITAAIIAVVILLILVLVVIAVLLGTVGRVGLIRGTQKAEQGAERLTFGELWRDGLTYFWRVFGLNLLLAIAIMVAVTVLIVLGVILSIGTLGVFLICLIPLICLLAPALWVVSIIVEQANVALVVENLSISEAIQRGWRIVVDHIGNMLVMGLILGVISLVGGVIFGIPLLPIAAPAVIGIWSEVTSNITRGILISAGLFLVYLPFLLFFTGLLRAYISSAWTLTYQQLTRLPAHPSFEAPILPEDISTPPAPVS